MIETHVFTGAPNGSLYRFVSFWGYDGNSIWKSAVIDPSCTPVAATDVVFVGTSDGKIREVDFNSADILNTITLPNATYVRGIVLDNNVIYANSGNALYARPVAGLGVQWAYQMGGQAWGSPVIANGMIYAGSLDNKVHAVHGNGAVAWIADVDSFFAAMPVVSNGVVYAVAFEKLYALDAQTGAVIWQAQSDDKFTFTQPVAVHNSVVYTTASDKIYGFDAAKGTPTMKKQLKPFLTAPTIASNRIFVSSQHSGLLSHLYAVEISHAAPTIWTSPIPISSDGGEEISPATVDEDGTNVFVTSQNGYIYAFARSDGWFAWKYRMYTTDDYPIKPLWCDDPLQSFAEIKVSESYIRTRLRREELEGWQSKSPKRRPVR
jgi:outer membrane protein assembly factor BamB